MSIRTLKPYDFPAADRLENFHGNQLLYVGWDEHLMFCSPFCFTVPPSQPFGQFVENMLVPAIAAHPDAVKVDWSQVQWLRSGQDYKPNFEHSLADNGLKHKDVLRFSTPGLAGIWGA